MEKIESQKIIAQIKHKDNLLMPGVKIDSDKVVPFVHIDNKAPFKIPIKPMAAPVKVTKDNEKPATQSKPETKKTEEKKESTPIKTV